VSDFHEIPFQRRVYKVVSRIPYGKVTTYGAIARALGSPRSARMVGYALNTIPDGLDVPAHRVIDRNGYLSGGWHFGHPDVMKDRLEEEGVEVSNVYVVDLGVYFWDPASDPEIDDLVIANY
jgi:methylated-DNA-protein-cysteine methyltransferase-like protein